VADVQPVAAMIHGRGVRYAHIRTEITLSLTYNTDATTRAMRAIPRMRVA
jgi:hypothetical protein